jgi:hypothetical protein
MPRLFIIRSSPSLSAVALATALRDEGIRAKKRQRLPRRILAGDAIVSWGAYLPDIPNGVRALNNVPLTGKGREIEALVGQEVPTVEMRRTLPSTGWPPMPDVNGWLPRSAVHHSGDDLLTPPRNPDFWVKHEEIQREFRIHVWNGVSSRVALKVPNREEGQYHPWIRSHSVGWRLDYGQGAHAVRQKHRDVAKAAISALKLDFGAVDVAERPDGSVFVLEVNRAPGLEGRTLEKYVEKVKEWFIDNRE